MRKKPDCSEHTRLSRLEALQVLDTGPEPLFDSLALAAAKVAGTPIALIALLGEDRQWFKANLGLPGFTQTARKTAFCEQVVPDGQILEVPDAKEDVRFANNPFVVGEPGVRFYAGAPIVLNDGVRIGSLCVLDREPHALTTLQRDILAVIARITGQAFEQRAMAILRNDLLERDALRERQHAEALALVQRALSESEQLLRQTGQVAGVGGWRWDLRNSTMIWTAQTYTIHDLPADRQPTLDEALSYYNEGARAILVDAIAHCTATATGWDLELPMRTALGRNIWVRTQGDALREGQEFVGFIGTIQDVSIRRQAVEAVEASEQRFRALFQHTRGFLWTHDPQGILLSVNPASAKALGYTKAELLGMPFSHLMAPQMEDSIRAYLKRIAANGSDTGLIELRAKDGQVLVWQYHNVYEGHGAEAYVLGHAQDVTSLSQQARLHEVATDRDRLTGCGNRLMLHSWIARTPPEACWGCIVINLDGFRAVNEEQGYERGDEVLTEMAAFLIRRCGLGDEVIRLSGDEFLLLLESGNDRYLSKVIQHLDRDRAKAPISFSVGAVTSETGERVEAAIARAEHQVRLGRAKRKLDR